METTNINNLKINVLTQEQYNAAEKDENQIYLITDAATADYLALSGGTLTGALILAADPTANLGAATKQYVDNGLSGKVDTVSGKGLSTNDYTTAEKNKLAGIATGATANTGTITAIQANGTNVATSGTANIPAASTSAYGVTKLSSATNSTSTTLAATASAVKAAYDLANGKAPAYSYGTSDYTAGSTGLTTGTLYFVYE